MPNARVVKNPFTKEEQYLRRNMQDSRWVSETTSSSRLARSRPTKTTPTPAPAAEPAPVVLRPTRYDFNSDEAVSLQTSTPPPHRYIRDSTSISSLSAPPRSTHPAYRERDNATSTDLSQKPLPLRPRQQVMASFVCETNDGRRRPSDILPVTQVPLTPSMARYTGKPLPAIPEPASYRPMRKDSVIEPVPLPSAIPLPGPGDRKESNATIWPGRDEAVAPRASHKAKRKKSLYKRAKEIYDAGPENDTVELIRAIQAYRDFRKAEKRAREGRMVGGGSSSDTHIDARGVHAQDVRAQDGRGRAPIRPKRPVQPEYDPITAAYNNTSGTEPDHVLQQQTHGRKGSDVSQSSGDLVIGIDTTLQSPVDLQKALPALPSSSYISPSSHTRPSSSKKTSSDMSSIHWWDSGSTNKERADRHDRLKAQIGRPRIISGLYDGRTANLSVKKGGLGGPTAGRAGRAGRLALIPEHGEPSPFIMANIPPCVTRRPPNTGVRSRRPPNISIDTSQLSERARGKQKAHDDDFLLHLREKIAGSGHRGGLFSKKSADSDKSFGCVGVADDRIWNPHSGSEPSIYEHTRGYGSSNLENENLLPYPLFSGRRGGRNGALRSA